MSVLSVMMPILVLGFLVFFHELGHFTLARIFGVKVEVFSIGFGKKIWIKQGAKTQYAISMIPLGGYVKLKGQDDLDPKKLNFESDSYMAKKPWQKILILLAGSGFNLLLALILYVIVAFAGSDRLLAVVGDVTPNMPAHSVGLQSGDIITKINGTKINSWEEMNAHIMESSGTLKVEYMRNDEPKTIEIKPVIAQSKNIFGEDIHRNMIGISSQGSVGVVRYTGIDAFAHAWDRLINASTLIAQSIAKLLSGAVSHKEVGGVISIVSVISSATQSGIVTLFLLTALISVNLGILNLLPIPALDGGHIIFSIYEWLSGKRASENVMYYLTLCGWAILGALLFLGLYNDILRLAQ